MTRSSESSRRPSIEELRDEYFDQSTHPIGPLIFEEIGKAASAIGLVGDGRDDAVQGATTDLLLRKGQIHDLITRARDRDHLHYLFRRIIRRWLAKEKRQFVISNLVDRSRKLLQTDDLFEEIIKGRPSAYCLKGANVEQRQPSPTELREAAVLAARHPRIVPKHAEERDPRVYSSKRLKLVVRTIAETLPCLFSLDDLKKIYDDYLTPWLLSDPDLHEGKTGPDGRGDIQAEDLSPEEETLVRDTVTRMKRELDSDQLDLLRRRLLGETDVRIAADLGVVRQTVAQRIGRVEQVIMTTLSELETGLQKAAIDQLINDLSQDDGGENPQ